MSYTRVPKQIKKVNMLRIVKLLTVVFAVALFGSCATTMSPTEVNETLPSLTLSTYYSQSQAEEALAIERCQYLDRGKSYKAPLGLTVKGDLRNAAKGIDEWVDVDGGNAYVLRSYNWETVDDYGSTQLTVEFDTMLCQN
jgi:hypothetical protein